MDCLFRLGPWMTRKTPIVYIHEITGRPQATASRIELLHEATAHKDDLYLFKHIVQARWPRQIQELPNEIQPYWKFHEEITIVDGLLLKCTRNIIHISQRQYMLKRIHAGHIWITKCLKRGKQTIYCLRLYSDIYESVTNLQAYLKSSNTSCKQLPIQQLGQVVPLMLWSMFPFENCPILSCSGFLFQVFCHLQTWQNDSQAYHKSHASYLLQSMDDLTPWYLTMVPVIMGSNFKHAYECTPHHILFPL